MLYHDTVKIAFGKLYFALHMLRYTYQQSLRPGDLEGEWDSLWLKLMLSVVHHRTIYTHIYTLHLINLHDHPVQKLLTPPVFAASIHVFQPANKHRIRHAFSCCYGNDCLPLTVKSYRSPGQVSYKSSVKLHN